MREGEAAGLPTVVRGESEGEESGCFVMDVVLGILGWKLLVYVSNFGHGAYSEDGNVASGGGHVGRKDVHGQVRIEGRKRSGFDLGIGYWG